MTQERERWSGRLDFLMSCISYAVGLGNIWRFPYLCYKNGGAVFLVPYLIFLTLCGMPLFFLEVSYGQFASLSPIGVWKISPLFKGIGYGMVIISGIVCIYYNIIITWTIFYLFQSFRSQLPWSDCGHPWNTPDCVDSSFNFANYSGDTSHLQTASEQFWERRVLDISSGIDDLGGIRWELMGCLALAWGLVFVCLIKGIKSSGKIVYFTATFPYMVLIALLIRAVTLPGSWDGLIYYIYPQFKKLLHLQVWSEAAMQIFYSIGAGWGALITMSSYNKFNNNCYRDARIIPILNCGTSIFAGFVIFAIIGFMSHETGRPVAEVVTQGPGLVFVVYPAAISQLPIAQLWSVLFFLMLLSIGIGSQFAMFQTLTSACLDEFPMLKKHRLLLLLVLCVLELLAGAVCITRGGMYFLTLMDWYSSTFSLMIISLVECLVISWIYGAKRFYGDIELMIGMQPCLWWRACWSVVTPSIIFCLFLLNVVQHVPVTYGDYHYPSWAIFVGWMFALCSIVPLPIFALVTLCRTPGETFGQKLRRSVRNTSDWGPQLPENRLRYEELQRMLGEGAPHELKKQLSSL